MGFLSNIIDCNNDILFYVILGILIFVCSGKDLKLDSLFKDNSALILSAIVIFLLFFSNKDGEREIE